MAMKPSVFSALAKASVKLQDAAEKARKAVEERKRRAEFAMISATTEKWVWITDPEQAFIPAKILKELPDGALEVEVGINRAVKTVKKAEQGPPITRLAELKNHVDDMVRMGDVNEATILHNLRARFVEDIVYTNIGTILVSLNPFKWFPDLYTPALMFEHLNLPPGEISTPHVFQIAAAAYQGVRGERKNQSIIISGESGAGKTEATKQCLNFFATAAGSTSATMSNKLLSANPILEAFGNAKTVRNNNSSRFGKWMEVHFNGRAQICGCQIINYLLEKSRVVFQASQERNYHIFYQLCLSPPPAMKATLALGDAGSYNFTNKSGCIAVDGLPDEEDFHEVLKSFSFLEIPPSEYEQLFTVVGGLLHLSNVTFDALDADKCKTSTKPEVTAAVGHASRLLGFAADDLKLAMEQKLIETRNERVRSPFSVEKALDTRNAMAKAIYGRQFDWLVTRVNSAMEGSLSASQNIIGVLDIFGFEIFEVNSFEQLCINFCNEKLQQHFNQHVFKAEEKCYKAEEIDYTEVKFVDNQDVLDLIELKPNGLLPKLDDETKVPKGSDAGYNDKITKIHADNPRFKGRVRRGNESREHEFGVNHYAGLVHYDVRGFMEKNKDELLLNVRELLKGSTSPFLKKLFEEEAGAAAGSGGRDKLSQSSQFRNQLDALMKTLNATEPHYIRCVKPNQVKKPAIFESQICLQQLRYAGVFEAVKIRQQGFPFRWTYELFYKRYRACAGSPGFRANIPKSGMDYREGVRKLVGDLVQAAPQLDGQLKFGKTMVLYRADPHRILEMMRDYTRDNAARVIERVWRGHRARKQVKVLFEARARVRAAIKSRDIALVVAAMAEAEKLPFQFAECKELKKLHDRLLEEKKCRESLASLVTFDPVDKYAEYEAVLKDATRLELTGEPLTRQVQQKFDTVKDRIETKANLAKGIELGDKALILASLKRAEELKKDWGDIVSPEAIAKAQDVLAVIAKEERVLDTLRAALATGGPTGIVGSLDTSRISTDALEAAIREATSGSIKVTTGYGHNLIATAGALRDLRKALKSGEWAAIETGVSAAVALRQAGKLNADAEPEVKKAEAEVADRRIQRVVTTALAVGGAKGRVGELNLASVETAGLKTAIGNAKAQADLVGGLSSPTAHLIACADMVLRLRHALVAGDWNATRKVVAEAAEVRLPEACLPEIQAAKDELDNHTLIYQLEDALNKGYPTGTVAKLDLSAVDVSLLGDRVAHAEEVGAKTAKAQALLKLAKTVRKIRQALLAGDYLALPELCKVASSVPKEFMPAATADELLVAQYEGENVIIVKGLREAITTGGPTGLIGNVVRSTVNTSLLAAALKKASALRCRSEEALWLYEVGEALREMREAFRDGAWAGLQESILSVRAMDKTRPSVARASASEGGSGEATGAAPVLVSRPRPTLPRMATLSSLSFADMVASAARSRAMSTETRVANGEGATQAASAMASRRASMTAAAMQAQLEAAGGLGAPHAISDLGDDGGAFMLPPATVDECTLVQEELNNHSILRDVTAALSSGQPAGPIGELDAGPSDLDTLSIALKRAERMGAKTPAAASLIYSARVVRDLRGSLKSGDWGAVESTLRYVAGNNARVVRFATEGVAYAPGDPAPAAGIPTSALGRVEVPPYAEDAIVLEQAGITLSMVAMPEVVRVEQEAEYRRVMALMTAALETGGPRSTNGVLDTAEVTTTTLASAIDAARSLGARTDRSRHLTTLCRLLWQLRTAVLEDDWASLESLLAASGEVLGKTAPLPAGCAVPAPLALEVELYRLEANNRRILAALVESCREGAAAGEIGRLDIGSIDVRRLEDALRLALLLGCETPEAKCLAATGLHLRSLRLALMAGQWERLGELLDYVHASLAANATRSWDFGAGRASLAPNPAAFLTPAYTNTKEGSGVMGSWAGVVEPRLGLDVASLGVSPLIASEVDTMQLELNNRNIIVQLTAAISRGGATGATGHLDLTPVETGQLEWAIDFAQRIGCATEDARQMLVTAVIIRKIRLALLAGDWGRLEGALSEAQGKVLADIGALEIHQAQDELNNRAILSELAAAMGKGRPQGRPGRLYTGSIDVQPLNEAITLASRLGPKTVEARQMLFTAKVVARLRLCLLNEDLAEAGLTLDAVRGKMLASVAMPEVRMVQDEVDNYTVVAELSAAIGSAGPAGAPGALDLSSVDTTALARAIERADEVGVKTSEAAALREGAAILFRLRSALLGDNWAAEDAASVESVLAEAARAGAPGEASVTSATPPISELVRPELALVQAEVDNRRMTAHLSAALARGGATGPVGELDTSRADVSELDAAIAEATELGPKTDEVSRLLQAAKIMRRLRSVLAAGNWQWVGSALLEARGVKHIFPAVCLRELQAAQDELDNRAIIAQVTTALRTGAASGAIERPSASALDVAVLDEAINYAKTLGVKSTEAAQVVATAQVVRRLRAALKAGAMEEVRDICESLKSKVLAPAANDELAYARAVVDDWTVRTELGAAIVTGVPTGLLGEVDARSVRTDHLDVAIARAMKLGCTTAEARHCLVTALVVRRLRDGFLKGDYEYLAATLAEAEREGPAILASAAPELQFARDLLAFREVMAALGRAVESQEEPALVDALSRASRMNLAEHPKPHVREALDAATLALGRIQRCKAALAAGIKALDPTLLIDALAMAAGMGYGHPLVEEGKRVLALVQGLTDRASKALRTMDAIEMQAALAECEAAGLVVPILADLRRCLALPHPEFLRRELAAVLAAAASSTTPSGLHAPLAEGPRAPTALEMRVVLCTLQLKDLFFADAPGDASLPDATTGPEAAARVARNVEDNLKGAAARGAAVPALGGFAWTLAGSAAAGTPFVPGGPGAPLASSAIGAVVPPAFSKLGRTFELARYGKLKPAHIFSRKYGVSDNSDTGMLRWQHEPIHTSLTLLADPNSRRLAVKTFRDILAFMGDRPLSRPLGLGQELLEMGVAVPELRDEIFVQLVKQLTGNPSAASAERGWVLLHLALATFPPSEELENHLELWLRARGALPCVWAMHLTLYRQGSGLAGAPSAAEIQLALERARAPALPALTFDLGAREDEGSYAEESPADSGYYGAPASGVLASPAVTLASSLAASGQLRSPQPGGGPAASPFFGYGGAAPGSAAKAAAAAAPALGSSLGGGLGAGLEARLASIADRLAEYK